MHGSVVRLPAQVDERAARGAILSLEKANVKKGPGSFPEAYGRIPFAGLP